MDVMYTNDDENYISITILRDMIITVVASLCDERKV